MKTEMISDVTVQRWPNRRSAKQLINIRLSLQRIECVNANMGQRWYLRIEFHRCVPRPSIELARRKLSSRVQIERKTRRLPHCGVMFFCASMTPEKRIKKEQLSCWQLDKTNLTDLCRRCIRFLWNAFLRQRCN